MMRSGASGFSAGLSAGFAAGNGAERPSKSIAVVVAPRHSGFLVFSLVALFGFDPLRFVAPFGHGARVAVGARFVGFVFDDGRATRLGGLLVGPIGDAEPKDFDGEAVGVGRRRGGRGGLSARPFGVSGFGGDDAIGLGASHPLGRGLPRRFGRVPSGRAGNHRGPARFESSPEMIGGIGGGSPLDIVRLAFNVVPIP